MIISGTVADRFSKTKIMFLSNFTRSLLLFGLVVWFLVGDLSLWTFVGFAFLFGILDAFFWAAESSVIPAILSKDLLTRGNSIIQMTNQSSFIVAPMLAGLLIGYGGYEMQYDAVSSLLNPQEFSRTQEVYSNWFDPKLIVLKHLVESHPDYAFAHTDDLPFVTSIDPDNPRLKGIHLDSESYFTI